jgi:hypothetical protein
VNLETGPKCKHDVPQDVLDSGLVSHHWGLEVLTSLVDGEWKIRVSVGDILKGPNNTMIIGRVFRTEVPSFMGRQFRRGGHGRGYRFASKHANTAK